MSYCNRVKRTSAEAIQVRVAYYHLPALLLAALGRCAYGFRAHAFDGIASPLLNRALRHTDTHGQDFPNLAGGAIKIKYLFDLFRPITARAFSISSAQQVLAMILGASMRGVCVVIVRRAAEREGPLSIPLRGSLCSALIRPCSCLLQVLMRLSQLSSTFLAWSSSPAAAALLSPPSPARHRKQHCLMIGFSFCRYKTRMAVERIGLCTSWFTTLTPESGVSECTP